MANDQPTEVAALHDALKQHHDLINASYYPETDEDIIIALVLRYLWQNVIQSDLYGCLPDYGLAIGSLEDSLQNHVIPKRGR